jgi:hypothetical protein
MNKAFGFLALIFLAGCAGSIIHFEQYSLAMDQAVEPDSSVYLGSDEKFQGVLWLSPILKQEKADVKSVKIIQNYGKYFVCAENFKNIYMIEPNSDGVTGTYKPIDVTPGDTTDVLTGISFARYGSKENTCVKFRYYGKEIFINREGEINEQCN